jgi:hypothetical protein
LSAGGTIPTFNYAAFSGITDFGGSSPQNTVQFTTLSSSGEAFATSGGVTAVQANGFFTTPGDAQTSQIIARAETIDATPVNLEVINNIGLPVSPFEILSGKTYAVTMTLTGRRSGGAIANDSYQAEISFLIVRAGALAPVQVGAASINAVANPAGAPGFTAAGTLPIGPSFFVTMPVVGLLGQTWRWVARINYIELSEG